MYSKGCGCGSPKIEIFANCSCGLRNDNFTTIKVASYGCGYLVFKKRMDADCSCGYAKISQVQVTSCGIKLVINLSSCKLRLCVEIASMYRFI